MIAGMDVFVLHTIPAQLRILCFFCAKSTEYCLLSVAIDSGYGSRDPPRWSHRIYSIAGYASDTLAWLGE